jgi:uncharacterized phage protein gp47/JayE
MASPPVPTIDAAGITAPAFIDAYTYFMESYQSIFGLDVYIEPDSQDGQDLGIRATAFFLACMSMVAVYNSFRPGYAQGAGLDSVVKINGIRRKVPSYSTVDLRIIGVAGTTIRNGVVTDDASNSWALPETVIIGRTGEVTVTATCLTIGAITAPPHTITNIESATQASGWQSVDNPSPAAPGAPVETDAELRERQTISTMLPSRSIADGLNGALASIDGVGIMRVYDNDNWGPDEYGIPGHTVAVVINGGNRQDIVDTIRKKKGMGVSTYGTTWEFSPDIAGVNKKIYFSRPRFVPITWYVSLKANPGFTIAIEREIAQSLVDWTNAIGIGNTLVLPQALIPAQLNGEPNSRTFRITALTVARDGIEPHFGDIAFAYDECAECSVSNIYFTVR